MNMQKAFILFAGLLLSGAGFAGGDTVPEMDAGVVPLVMGLTLAMLMLLKDKMNK